MSEEARRILLVDDDEFIVELLALRLKAAGYDVFTAVDGKNAYDVFLQCHPHLVLCDVVMPVMDGPAFCRKLRAEGILLPFIFLTAKGQPDDIVSVLAAGADDYVIKPFDPGELQARIKTLLRKSYP